MAEEGAVAYLVRCHRCLEEFDATQSAWCSCLGPAPSLVCPHCLTCFCQAPRDYRSAFWEKAPRALCRKRQELKHTRGNNHDELMIPEQPPARPFILVVEDEKDVRCLAGELLSELGYHVVVAANGEEGLDLATRLKPDLVLADAVLPRLSGREMCLQVKGAPETRGIPVVIMSGIFTKETHKTQALRTYKADGYLRKPISLRELGETCAHFLGAATQR